MQRTRSVAFTTLMLLFACASTDPREPELVEPGLREPGLREPEPIEPALPGTYLAELCEELRQTWPDNRTIRIVCHGHSVPAGYFRTPVVQPFDSYPFLLRQGLQERFPHAVINVIVTAIGGENSASGADRFASDVLTHRPDLITIDYALNDRRIGLEASRASLESMLREARDGGVPVLLLTPTLDLRANLDDPNDPLLQHADQVRALAREHGVGLVDSLAAFLSAIENGTEPGALMSIANHPNHQGHELVAGQLLDWFTPE